MADPASILGLISTAASFAQGIYQYTSSFQNAPKCAAKLGAEVTAVGHVLAMLRDHLQLENTKGRAFDRTSVLFCAADGCKKRLEEIDDILSPLVSRGKTSRFLKRLRWPIDEVATMQEVEALHRYAQLFEFALNIDGFAILSTTQSDALAHLQAKLDTLSASAATQSIIVQSALRDVVETVKILPYLATTVEEIWERVDRLVLDADRSVLLNSLPSLPFAEKHRDIQLRRTSGLGQWLLDSPEFRALSGGLLERNTLWCHGAPGAGKTFLSSTVIDHLETQSAQQKFRIVYFYFDYRQQSEQTPFQVVACLLKQVLSSISGVPSAAAGLYKRLKEGKGLPNWEELTQTFVNVCSDLDDVFLVLDALDESDENTNRQPILSGVLDHLIRCPARLFVTSRSHCLDINSTFENCPQITVEAADSDVQEFVDRKIRESRRMAMVINGDLREEIVQIIVDKSQGMFLLPALQIKNILSQTSESEVRQALRELPFGLIQNLDLAIERIKRQDPQSPTKASRAMQTLMWLSHAKRAIIIDELRHVLAIKTGNAEFDPGNLMNINFLIESCLGLVIADKETSKIRLVHLSVNDYLLERQEELFPHGHGRLAIDCLNYLLLKDFQISIFHQKSDLDKLLVKFPFLTYAAFYWGQHAAQEFNPGVENLTRIFLNRETCLLLWGQLIEMKEQWKTYPWNPSDVSKFVVTDTSPLHVAARFGIVGLAQDFLQKPTSNPNMTDSLNRTPIMLAAAHGHISILRMLLEREDIDFNLIDCNHRTALGVAVKYGQAESVDVLLSYSNIDVNLGTPLLDAADDYLTPDYQLSLSKKGISKLLLARPDLDVNVVSSGMIPRSAWDILARTGDFDTFQLLLGRSDFDPDHSNSIARQRSLEGCVSDCCNYLFNSNVMCEEAVVNIALIIRMIDQDHRLRFPYDYCILRYTWPIIYYAFSGAFTANPSEICEVDGQYIWQNSPKYRPRLLELLTTHGFTPFIKDSEGRTYLHYTAMGQNEEHVRYLLELGLDVAAVDKTGRTPLHYVAKKGGSESIARLLLASGANISALDAEALSPLKEALDNGNESLALFLLNKGPDSSISDKYGRRPLHAAAEKGYPSTVQRLLDLGENPLVEDKLGWTPLHSAAGSNSENAVQVISILLGAGARVSTGHEDKYTPLHVAALIGTAESCSFLLAKGMDPSAKSISGTCTQIAVQSMNESKIRVFLEYGGDLNALDCYGRRSGDWILAFEPLSRALSPLMISYEPKPANEARSCLLGCIRERIDLILSQKEDSKSVYTRRLGKQLLLLNDDSAARIVFGFDFWYTRRRPGTLYWNQPCSNCGVNSNTSRYVCKSCPDLGLFCLTCVRKPPENDKFPWCRGHEYLEVPFDGWYELPEGVVNEDGETFEQWLMGIRRKYSLDDGQTDR